MFYVYALYAEKFDKIYIGYSKDPIARLEAHNNSSNKGWTRKYMPWKMIYKEQCATKADALVREKQLKTPKGRSFVRSKILSQNKPL